jgi:hypothetical protein
MSARFEDLYGVKMSAASARSSSVLSMPHRASPSGRSLVRMALLSTSPVSPLVRTFTVKPVFAVNAARVSFGSVNES